MFFLVLYRIFLYCLVLVNFPRKALAFMRSNLVIIIIIFTVLLLLLNWEQIRYTKVLIFFPIFRIMRALHCKWIEVFSSLVQKCYIYLRKTYKKNLNGLLWYFGNSVMATSNTPQHIDIKMFKSSYDCVGCWIIAAFVFCIHFYDYYFYFILFLFFGAMYFLSSDI